VAQDLHAADVEPEPPRVVFAGTPVLLFGETDQPGITLQWDAGGSRTWPLTTAGDSALGEALRLLRGARLITDWESRYPAEEAVAAAGSGSALDRRQESRVAARLSELSRTYGLASREMSLVAVVQRTGDRPGQLPQTVVVPVGVPKGMAVEAIAAAPPLRPGPIDPSMILASRPPVRRPGALFGARFSRPRKSGMTLFHQTSAAATPSLLDLAGQLQTDGGMPGISAAIRTARSIAALLAFAAEGHSANNGAFRQHVKRLVHFLKSLTPADSGEARWIGIALNAAAPATGGKNFPPGPWLHLAALTATSIHDLDQASARE
jgi:hypothetical protein